MTALIFDALLSATLLKEKLPDFFSRNTDQFTIFLTLGFGLVVVAALVFGVKRSTRTQWLKQKAVFSTDEVFDRLCEANHLSRDEIFIVKRMIFDLRLDNPILVFINPDYVQRYLPDLTQSETKTVKSIQEKLFGDIETAQML